MENEEMIPENFKGIVYDFINDLSITFPEYSYLWSKWGSPTISDIELKNLFDYLITVYPERFFDILYQNEDIFKPDSSINTCFLPNVDFKLLFHCENVTENIHKTLWKYLQLFLFTILGSVKNKANFGETMNLFEGIDENDLQEKLQETMNSMGDFFSHIGEHHESPETKKDDEGAQNTENMPFPEMPDDFLKNAEKIFENIPNMGGLPNMNAFKKAFDFEKMKESMPNPEEIHSHLKGLFEGKIGTLAKEMAEEITNDISSIFGEDCNDIQTSKDVLQKLLKNPKKMMEIVKLVGNKLNKKMQSGEISQDEIMKEASDLIGKMKGMGGAENFGEIFKTMAKQMGGGLGKNARVNTGAINNMVKTQTMKDRMKNRIEQKKMMAAMQQMSNNTQEQPPANFVVEQKNENQFVFKMNNNEKQEKSSSRKPQHLPKEDIDKIMQDLNLENDVNDSLKTKEIKKKKKAKK